MNISCTNNFPTQRVKSHLLATCRLLALMGSSGAGKTTLLNALAGQLPINKCLRLSGSITVNGQSLK
eukprot:2414461-Pyramimonas_sp.AAC.1